MCTGRMNNPPPNVLAFSYDFMGVMTWLPLDQLQSDYYSSDHVKGLVLVVKRQRDVHDPPREPSNEAEEAGGDSDEDQFADEHDLVEDWLFFLASSNDIPRQNWVFVQNCIRRMVAFYRERGHPVETLWPNSDGCGEQFKSRTPFLGLSRLPKLLDLESVDAAFAGSNRFKWKHDTAGGWMKMKVRREQMDSEGMLTGTEMNVPQLIKFLELKGTKNVELEYKYEKKKKRKAPAAAPAATEPGDDATEYAQPWNRRKGRGPNRFFFQVTAQDYEEEQKQVVEAENAVQGTHALHQIVTTREGVLRKRNLLCSCDMCCSQGTDVQDCANAGMVPEWSPEIQIRGLTLNPITRADKLAKLTDDGEEAAANGSFAMNTLVSLPNPGGQPPFHILEVMGEPDVVDAAWVKAHGPVVSPVLSDEHGEPIVMYEGTPILTGYFHQPLSKKGRKWERWDHSWASQGKFSSTFKKWDTFPQVVFPAGMVRHHSFTMTPSPSTGRDKNRTLNSLSDEVYESIIKGLVM